MKSKMIALLLAAGFAVSANAGLFMSEIQCKMNPKACAGTDRHTPK